MAVNQSPGAAAQGDPFLMVSKKWRGAATEEPQNNPDVEVDGLQISRAGVAFESEPVGKASGSGKKDDWDPEAALKAVGSVRREDYAIGVLILTFAVLSGTKIKEVLETMGRQGVSAIYWLSGLMEREQAAAASRAEQWLDDVMCQGRQQAAVSQETLKEWPSLVRGNFDEGVKGAQEALAERQAYLQMWAQETPGVRAIPRLWAVASETARQQVIGPRAAPPPTAARGPAYAQAAAATTGRSGTSAVLLTDPSKGPTPAALPTRAARDPRLLLADTAPAPMAALPAATSAIAALPAPTSAMAALPQNATLTHNGAGTQSRATSSLPARRGAGASSGAASSSSAGRPATAQAQPVFQAKSKSISRSKSESKSASEPFAGSKPSAAAEAAARSAEAARRQALTDADALTALQAAASQKREEPKMPEPEKPEPEKEPEKKAEQDWNQRVRRAYASVAAASGAVPHSAAAVPVSHALAYQRGSGAGMAAPVPAKPATPVASSSGRTWPPPKKSVAPSRSGGGGSGGGAGGGDGGGSGGSGGSAGQPGGGGGRWQWGRLGLAAAAAAAVANKAVELPKRHARLLVPLALAATLLWQGLQAQSERHSRGAPKRSRSTALAGGSLAVSTGSLGASAAVPSSGRSGRSDADLSDMSSDDDAF